jgi:hypothetical protein
MKGTEANQLIHTLTQGLDGASMTMCLCLRRAMHSVHALHAVPNARPVIILVFVRTPQAKVAGIKHQNTVVISDKYKQICI